MINSFDYLHVLLIFQCFLKNELHEGVMGKACPQYKPAKTEETLPFASLSVGAGKIAKC